MPTLSGKNTLVTSGPTRAPLDDVRFISSRSSGWLGVTLARELLSCGAAVTFLHGAGSIKPAPQERLHLIEVETVDQLIQTVEGLRDERFDAIFHAMSVSDFAPEKVRKGKVSTQKEGVWEIRLVRTPKVIKLMRETWPQSFIVGFKLEVGQDREGLVEKARELISDSGADMVVANDLTQITEDSHVAYIVSKTGEVSEPAHTKGEIAARLVRQATAMIAPGASSGPRSP